MPEHDPPPTLVLLCKRPAPGHGKQRLAASLGAERACAVAWALLDCALEEGTVQVDDSVDVHLELPPGVELGAGDAAGAVRRVEREG
jgi:glycosyltransferase A (GT-A) superfamily protein (DUF2064 family)